MKKIILIGLIGLLVFSGCAAPRNNTEKGATLGTVGGAVAGAVLGGAIGGGDPRSVLLGTAAGAAVGAAAGVGTGQMMDKQEAAMQAALAESEAASLRREGDLVAITLKGDVSFDYDSDVVRPGLYNELDRIAEIMIEYPQTTILVEGHTDSTGSEAYNRRLSDRRAARVKNLLIERGVQAYRINTLGCGESSPVATNTTPEGRQMNRRVQIRIQPTAQG